MISIFLRSVSDLFVLLKKQIWNINRKEKHFLKVLPGHSYWFHHFGDITRILFTKQHLVSRKKSFEYHTLAKYKSIIKKGDTILDIGANIGVFSLLGSELAGKDGKVFAFEPSKETFDVLEKNIMSNNAKNITPVQIALSEKKGLVKLQTSQLESHSFQYNDSLNYFSEDQDGDIPSNTIDDFILTNKISSIDVIKIDVEGAEFLSLKGGVNTLINHKPIVLFEAFEDYCKRFEYTVYDLLNFISELNYSIYQLNESQWIAYPK